MGLRIVTRNILNPGAIALLIIAVAITAGAGCSNERNTPGTFREELAESRTDSGGPAPTSTTEVVVQPAIPDDTRRSQTNTSQIEEPREIPTQNPQMEEANRSAGIKNNICWRTPEVQEQIIQDLSIPSCQIINESELFRIRNLGLETPSVKPGDFDHLPNLQGLGIHKLRELPPEETFTGLPNLQQLVIKINPDGWQQDEKPDSLTITPGTFTGLEGLEFLEIQSPFALTLEGHPLSDLEQIKYIRLAGLKEISSTHLAGLNQLKHISIVATQNRDQARPVIPRDLLSQLPALEQLEIQGFEWPASLEVDSLETICRMKNIAGLPDTVLTVDGKIVQYMESNHQDGMTTCTFKVEDQIKTIPYPEQ